MKKCLLGIAMLLTAGFSFAQESFTVTPSPATMQPGDEQEFIVSINVSESNVLNLRTANFYIQIPEGLEAMQAYGNKLRPKYVDMVKESSLEMLEATVEVVYRTEYNVLGIAVYHTAEDVGFPMEQTEQILKFKLRATDKIQTGEKFIVIGNKPFTDGFEGEDVRMMCTTLDNTEVFPEETQNPINLEVNFEVGESGYATLCWPVALDFDGTGLSAFAATGIEKGMVSRQEVKTIPAATPVIIEAAAGTYKLQTTADEVAAPSVNILKGTADGAYTATANTFALAKKAEGVGFYRCTAGVEIPQYKAYIENEGSADESFLFEETTGINTLDAEAANADVYTISGVKVQNASQKGIYIVNGKKVVK